ncbi:MAG: GIY-YIG nuclease family protein [bacterium]|nr:GIY-YIG nuclease family protein [bacterium]
MYVVYLLKSSVVKKSYVGVTNDIGRRIAEHNSGKHFYTERHMPWKIVYTEEFPSFDEARKREKYLKTASGRRFLKKIFDRAV